MVLLKFWRDDYGCHIHVAVGKVHFQAKLHYEYDLAQTAGVRNNCVDGSRLLFMDYDHHEFSHVLGELDALQVEFGLSDFYIFKSSQTKNAFHAICLDKLSYQEFLQIMRLTSCDEYYKVMPVENDKHSWVLRLLSKRGSNAPRIVHVLKSKFQDRVKSLAHYLVLRSFYGVSEKPKNCDKSKVVYDIHYKTMNFIKKGKI